MCVPTPADVPKALVGAAILRDKARPEWPDGSSMCVMVTAAAAAAAGAEADECMPPTAYRELTAACWDHEARARWADNAVCSLLHELLREVWSQSMQCVPLCISNLP